MNYSAEQKTEIEAPKPSFQMMAKINTTMDANGKAILEVSFVTGLARAWLQQNLNNYGQFANDLEQPPATQRFDVNPLFDIDDVIEFVNKAAASWEQKKK